MASIRREIVIEARPADVWDAIRDVGAVHTRLAPGFVTDTKMDGDARIVTFGNGLVARELIVDVSEDARRLVWAVVGGRLTHHNASLQVLAHGDAHCRAVWVADLLPNDLAGTVAGMIEQGMGIMKHTLEQELETSSSFALDSADIARLEDLKRHQPKTNAQLRDGG